MSIYIARGDRMKQAQVDADELIAAYRLEQQDAFDKKANADGKSNIFIREHQSLLEPPAD